MANWAQLGALVSSLMPLVAKEGSQAYNFSQGQADFYQESLRQQAIKEAEKEAEKKKKGKMGGAIGSALGTIAGVVAAPFTGGTSLLIPIAMGAGGGMLGSAAGQAIGGGEVDPMDVAIAGGTGAVSGLTAGGLSALTAAPAAAGTAAAASPTAMLTGAAPMVAPLTAPASMAAVAPAAAAAAPAAAASSVPALTTPASMAALESAYGAVPAAAAPAAVSVPTQLTAGNMGWANAGAEIAPKGLSGAARAALAAVPIASSASGYLGGFQPIQGPAPNSQAMGGNSPGVRMTHQAENMDMSPRDWRQAWRENPTLAGVQMNTYLDAGGSFSPREAMRLPRGMRSELTGMGYHVPSRAGMIGNALASAFVPNVASRIQRDDQGNWNYIPKQRAF